MANYATLKAAIQAVIKQNGNNEITGALLQQSLLSMIDSLGANYQFAGFANTSTNPGTPDQNVIYLAGPGTYPNFGGTVVPDGALGAFKYNGSWQYTVVALTEDIVQEIYEVAGQNLLLNRLYGRFVNGNLASGVLNTAVKYRVATNDIMTYNYDIVLTPTALYKFGIHYFENGVFHNDSGWKTAAVQIPKGQQFKIVIAKRAEQTSVVADVDEFVSNVSITNINAELVNIRESITDLGVEFDGKLAAKQEQIDTLNTRISRVDGNVVNEFFQGNIATSGALNPMAIRVTTIPLINVTGPLFVKCFGDVRINIVHRYATNELNSNFITETVPVAEKQQYTIPINENYPYVNITFERASNNTQNILIPEVANNTIVFFDGYIKTTEQVQENKIGIARLNNRINGGNVDVVFTQGGYTDGVPNSAPSRIRFDRMLIENELGIKITIPNSVDARLYGYNLYSEAGNYDSFISWNSFPANTKEIVIDKTFIGTAKGVSVVFCRASDYSQNIAPADMAGTTVTYQMAGIGDLEQRVENLEEQLPSGNTEYYGRPVSLPITSRVNRLDSELLLSHTPGVYSHTKYNQSMAAYNGKLFCFNDTSLNDGFCVVIDIATKNVLYFVTTIPSVLENSHVNNACFTDVFYNDGDVYPLILISRGDYPNGTDKGKEMYIFRIVESGGAFSFTLIKTIKTQQYFFGASWEYDANRQMIWGHLCKHGDWRWGNSAYRKFNDSGLYFGPDSGTNYICIATNEIAAANAEITITLNGATSQTKTVNVQAGQTLSPEQTIMPYSPASYGYAYIKANQSANAFSGQYTVYSCDENGQNRKAINYECVIGGFASPTLTDQETTIISESEMTLAKMDSGIFQGGCCYGGKLFLPFQNYATINGAIPSYTGHCCLVVNPESGVVETLIPTDTLENEGCAILDGLLYISSHNANAAETGISFKVMKYIF